MQTLCRLRWLACFTLAWFAVSIGVAAASPLVRPQLVELVCSGAGETRLIAYTPDGVQVQGGHTLDCPLCIQVGAPPPPALAHRPAPHPLAQVLLPPAPAHWVARTAAPLPARGPPVL